MFSTVKRINGITLKRMVKTVLYLIEFNISCAGPFVDLQGIVALHSKNNGNENNDAKRQINGIEIRAFRFVHHALACIG